jgi:hypothetical protein
MSLLGNNLKFQLKPDNFITPIYWLEGVRKLQFFGFKRYHDGTDISEIFIPDADVDLAKNIVNILANSALLTGDADFLPDYIAINGMGGFSFYFNNLEVQTMGILNRKERLKFSYVTHWKDKKNKQRTQEIEAIISQYKTEMDI